MKISELVSELEVLWAEHGDVDVYTVYDCNCCPYGDEPFPRIKEEGTEEFPAGVYV